MIKETQEHQVIEALRKEGGFATLRRLNEIVDFSMQENENSRIFCKENCTK